MSQQAHDIFTLSFIAANAVTQYRGVDFSGNQIAAQGARICGVAKRPAAVGDNFEVAVVGTATCEAGAVIAVGQLLQMDNQGRVIPADAATITAGAVAVTSSAANGAILSGGYLPESIIGTALEAASAAGNYIEVLLHR